jgi:hypothetical protein
VARAASVRARPKASRGRVEAPASRAHRRWTAQEEVSPPLAGVPFPLFARVRVRVSMEFCLGFFLVFFCGIFQNSNQREVIRRLISLFALGIGYRVIRSEELV